MRRRLAKLLLRLSYAACADKREELAAALRDAAQARQQAVAELAPVAPPANVPDWLPEHRALWRSFLASPAGQALMGRGRGIQFANNTRACSDVFHTSHSAGAAKGFGECLDWLESLSRTSRVNEASGADDNTTSDTQAPGEAQLREFMSP